VVRSADPGPLAALLDGDCAPEIDARPLEDEPAAGTMIAKTFFLM
jgi:hypothetical protein